MVDFSLSERQTKLRRTAAAFADNVLKTARQIYEQHTDPHEAFKSTKPLHRKAVEAGIVKMQVPLSLDGEGGSLVDTCILIEELYAVDPSVSMTILATGLGLLPLIIGGTASQKEQFLKPFVSGNGEPLAGLTHSEPQGSANWLERGGEGLKTTARQDGNDWIIDGEKVNLLSVNPTFAKPPLLHRCGRPTPLAGTSAAPTSNASSAVTLLPPLPTLLMPS
jgi:alkylation response protein AidB-like acyl-CoA dehydrogenase